jgi:glycosyltransferase involved in cell wall biosynthesis
MFSVIVPTYNRVSLLANTIDSLLRQDYAEAEIIVVNDGSSDGTEAYLSGLASEGKVIALTVPNGGPSVARRAGLTKARGEFVAFTDDDCVVPPGWLTAFSRVFEDPTVAGIGGPTETGNPENIFAVTNDLINNHFKEVLNGRPGAAPYLTSNNVAYRRGALERAGGHDTRFHTGAEDRDLDYRIAAAGGRLVYSSSVRIRHFNDSDLRAFLSHQFRQGRGSFLYYSVDRDGAPAPDPIPLQAYLSLLVAPFRILPTHRALAAATLIILAQGSIVAGFVSALVKGKGTGR